MKYLIVGGFEASGHDSTAEAVIEEGLVRGHHIDSLIWRDTEPLLADHPMFTSHRYAAAQGVSDIAGLLDETWIGKALAADLASKIPLGYDGYICVHPWSSLIVATALNKGQNSSALLVDYHSDFGAYPVIQDQRINAYLGGGRRRSLSPKVRARCHYTGVSVPRRFHFEAFDTQLQPRPSRLVVSAGADGWAIRAMYMALRRLQEDLLPEEIVLLAPTDEADAAWRNYRIPNSVISYRNSDIATTLRSARWYLSKGGGTAVAEGLAAGCLGFVALSGIFWEDEAAEQIHAQGIAMLVRDHVATQQHSPLDIKKARFACQNASIKLWSLIEEGMPKHDNPAEVEVLDKLAFRLAEYGHDQLPITTGRLAENIARWRCGWAS